MIANKDKPLIFSGFMGFSLTDLLGLCRDGETRCLLTLENKGGSEIDASGQNNLIVVHPVALHHWKGDIQM